MDELRRAVIKQELVELTGDYIKALILNQFLYWSKRVKDFDRFIEEERGRLEQEGKSLDMEPTNGWIYKTEKELIEETMLGVSQSTMNRNVKALVEMGYLLWRNNPVHKWDRTKQYRVDIVKVRRDLAKMGYSLDGYAFFTEDNASFTEHNASFTMNNGEVTETNREFTMNDRTTQSEYAIPKITTKTTSKITNKHTTQEIRSAFEQIAVAEEPPDRGNNKERVCDQNELDELKGALAVQGIRVPDKVAMEWLALAGIAQIIYACQLARQDGVRNPAAYISGVLKNGVVIISNDNEEKNVRDERYGEFYQLFPDS